MRRAVVEPTRFTARESGARLPGDPVPDASKARVSGVDPGEAFAGLAFGPAGVMQFLPARESKGPRRRRISRLIPW
ncbi:hypothetical protein GCM10011504_18960 [Siccirubricoccus deserti]|nr:hypothetical protein GCM10011504_18960 [Siccirubricoccus deserti]